MTDLPAAPPAFLTVFARSRIALSLAIASVEDTPLITVNVAFEKLTGFSAAEAVGQNCRFLHGPDTEPQQRATLRKAIQNKSEIAVPIVNYKKDGTRFFNYVYVFPILSRNGELLYLLGSQFDVSTQLANFTAVDHADALDGDIRAANAMLREAKYMYIEATRTSSLMLRDMLQSVARLTK
jgi:PAS domain S-box-containing protein